MSELSNDELEQAIQNATDEELMEIKGIGSHTVGRMRDQLGQNVWDAVVDNNTEQGIRCGRLHKMISSIGTDS